MKYTHQIMIIDFLTSKEMLEKNPYSFKLHVSMHKIRITIHFTSIRKLSKIQFSYVSSVFVIAFS